MSFHHFFYTVFIVTTVHVSLPADEKQSAVHSTELNKIFPVGKDVTLFDGRSLKGWRVVDKTIYNKHGNVTVDPKPKTLIMNSGQPGTAIAWKGIFPCFDYEVQLDAKRIDGSDFFCGLTFPFDTSHVTLILGGWGGGATGLSNVDNMSAVENETSSFRDYKKDQWYSIRLRVTSQKIEAWVDDDQIIDLNTVDRDFSIWWEQEPVRPFGIANWYTTSGLRNIRVKRITNKKQRESDTPKGSSPKK